MTTVTGVLAIRDEDILAQAQAGEVEAFTRLVEAHHQSMVRVAYVICGDVELARDAAQTAWIRAWQRIGSVREPARLRAWLVAIAANEARQASRSRRRRALREVPIPDLEPASIQRSMDPTLHPPLPISTRMSVRSSRCATSPA